MKFSENENGAIIIEATVVIPLLMVVMLLFIYLVNIFVVQSLVQYGLNQTVNELGNYTYYLNYLGLIDLSNSADGALKKATKQNEDDIKTVTAAYSSVVDTLSGAGQAAGNFGDAFDDLSDGFDANELIANIKKCVSGVVDVKDQAIESKGKVMEVWDMVKNFAKNPTQLLMQLSSQLFAELKDAGHSLLGGFLGKIMLEKYIDNAILENCGVVSTEYNGTLKKGEYLSGISGIDFTHSNFLGGEGSRQIDLIVYYRIKFPFNLSGWAIGNDGPLYDNSLLVVQRASGYGWINGDGKGKSEYNGVAKRGFNYIFHGSGSSGGNDEDGEQH